MLKKWSLVESEIRPLFDVALGTSLLGPRNGNGRLYQTDQSEFLRIRSTTSVPRGSIGTVKVIVLEKTLPTE